ncbi:predicted protein [Uncinocarpus reesii 1704]|uniref:A to I editase domain-containing protein n=1 Tax=Uncinocarpus reesii (strain UAMH 1704) TaxID=336963 RepID=C4JKC1_UNCRE|nr:uncharacterized protein UREG_02078 [Uncinocarpus reesii 1704]EEP77229.1 predicted protein [Uncinocarpus reesii 1704]
MVGNDEEMVSWPPFKFKDNVKIWMYCTCAPCGDASMELCMAAQEDPTPWQVPAADATSAIENNLVVKLLDGRAHFSVLGAVRRKPSRADAQPTLSKSCSDKLAARQVTSVLSFPASLLIAPSPNAYLANVVLPANEISQTALKRAFGSGEQGRLHRLNGRKWQDEVHSMHSDSGYAFTPFDIRALPMDLLNNLWKFSKIKDASSKHRKISNFSAVWTATPTLGTNPAFTIFGQDAGLPYGQGIEKTVKAYPTNVSEIILNGVRQGYHISSSDVRKASVLSRARMWDLLCEVVQLLPDAKKDTCTSSEDESSKNARGDDANGGHQFLKLRECVFHSPTYSMLKQNVAAAKLLHLRNKASADVRQVLGNWIENRGDGHWGLRAPRSF